MAAQSMAVSVAFSAIPLASGAGISSRAGEATGGGGGSSAALPRTARGGGAASGCEAGAALGAAGAPGKYGGGTWPYGIPGGTNVTGARPAGGGGHPSGPQPPRARKVWIDIQAKASRVQTTNGSACRRMGRVLLTHGTGFSA